MMNIDLLSRHLEPQSREATALSDIELSSVVRNALGWNTYVPASISSSVQNSMVTLSGTCTCRHESDAALATVNDIEGIAGVENLIRLERRNLKRETDVSLRPAAHHSATGQMTLKVNTWSWSPIEAEPPAAAGEQWVSP